MAKTIFDKLHLSSVTDGDWRVHDLYGLSRLSPYLFMGSDQLEQITVNGYYDCPDLAQFRLAVREIRPQPAPSNLDFDSDECADSDKIEKELREGTPDWNKRLACPNLFDLDTRNLYFGQLNQDPKHAYYKVGQEATPDWKTGDPGPEGRSVKGMPVRLQQVHFTAHNPANTRICPTRKGITQEYSAYFLVSNPVGPIPDTCPPEASVCIDSDFNLQRKGEVVYWTYNRWTVDGKEETAKVDWTERLVMGAKDAGTEFFEKLTEALTRNGGLEEGGLNRCLPRIVTHVFHNDCGLHYNYVELSKAQPKNLEQLDAECPYGIVWTPGTEEIIPFTTCQKESCSPHSTSQAPCGSDSGSATPSTAHPSYEPTSLLPSSGEVQGGGQIGCPRDYCPGMEPGSPAGEG